MNRIIGHMLGLAFFAMWCSMMRIDLPLALAAMRDSSANIGEWWLPPSFNINL